MHGSRLRYFISAVIRCDPLIQTAEFSGFPFLARYGMMSQVLDASGCSAAARLHRPSLSSPGWWRVLRPQLSNRHITTDILHYCFALLSQVAPFVA
jgi:hypothetical protein